MRVLVVAPVLPHARVRHAGGLYLFDHLEHLAARVDQVTLLCIDTRATKSDASAAPAGVTLRVADTSRQPIPSWRRLVHGVGMRARWSALGADAVEALERAGLVALAADADVVELHWPELVPLARRLRRAGVTTPISIVLHDLASEAAPSRARARGGRAAAVAAASRPVRDLVERLDLGAADLVLAFKPGDATLLARRGLRVPVAVIAPRLEPAVQHAPTRSGVLFTGALWRPENDLAARWLVQRVWPAVRAAVDGATLTIAGAGPSGELRGLAECAGGVVVTGEVDDLAPLYAAAAVFVAPQFVAGGLKFKVPQAMRHGLPVVASTIAAAGIVDVAPPGTLWAVTDDAAAMASAITSALCDPTSASRVGAAAAVWAERHWSFEASMDTIVGRYRSMARQQ